MRLRSDSFTASGAGARLAPPRPFRTSVLALAGMLAIGGCSAGGGGGGSVAEGGHSGLHLSPSPATSATRIAVVFADDRLRAANCRFEWRRNGSVIADATTSGLDPSEFKKHDEITVVASAVDPSVGKVRKLSGSVKVENTPPKLTGLSLVVSTASGKPELVTHVECADPDGDVPTYSYRWFKNNDALDNTDGASLPLTRFGRGDQIVVEVVARDDESASLPRRSDPYRLDNRPPEITSQPITPTVRDAVFQYHVTAADPDGDALHYELVTAPAGMTVDSAGNVHWDLPAGEARHGAAPVRIRVTDAKGGEATQDFTIQLDPPPIKT